MALVWPISWGYSGFHTEFMLGEVRNFFGTSRNFAMHTLLKGVSGHAFQEMPFESCSALRLILVGCVAANWIPPQHCRLCSHRKSVRSTFILRWFYTVSVVQVTVQVMVWYFATLASCVPLLWFWVQQTFQMFLAGTASVHPCSTWDALHVGSRSLSLLVFLLCP